MTKENGSKSADDSVPGAAIAAAIMKRLPVDVRERVLESMEQNAPTVCASVESFLFPATDLVELPAASLRAVLQIAVPDDIALCAHSASLGERERILENLPEPKAAPVREALGSLVGKSVGAESAKAKRRILSLLSELQTSSLPAIRKNSGRYA